MKNKHGGDIVLVHGWGFGGRVWGEFVPYLEDRYRVGVVDLSGYGKREYVECFNVDEMVRQLDEDVPKGASILAWSMGGLLATRLANTRKDIKALVFIASSPCFLNKTDWHYGIDPVDFGLLVAQINKDKAKALKDFAGLVATGDKAPRKTMKTLNKLTSENTPEEQTLKAGLEILWQEDLRSMYLKLQCPLGMIFGENDILIKSSGIKALQETMPELPAIEIEGAGHAPFLSRPGETADALTKLLDKYL